jgi:hypothetical protein
MNALTKSQVVAYLALIFIAGGALGAVITLNSARQSNAQPPSMEKTCNRLQDRMTAKLELTPDQIARLQPVFDETAEALRTVHSNALCDTDRILRAAHEKIAKELRPDQRAKLETFDSQRTEWLKRHLKGGLKSEGRKSEAEPPVGIPAGMRDAEP